MLISLNGYSSELTCDFLSSQTDICIEDTETIFNELRDGDYTYLRVSNDFVYEIIKVTRVVDELIVERAQCQDDCCEPEIIDFYTGDCVDYYTDAFNCDNTSDETCPVTITSTDNSIFIDEVSNCEFDLKFNTDILPSLESKFCELEEGTLLFTDYIIVLRKNGESCSLHLVPVSELCERLGDC